MRGPGLLTRTTYQNDLVTPGSSPACSCARATANVVFPTPGISSISTWPLHSNAKTASLTVPSLPTITADASTYWKFGASTIIGTAGMLYLGYGKKNNDVQKMIIGAVLTLASVLFI